MMKYIVTGTGRCGTGYMAKLLTTNGIPCGHEQAFTVKKKRRTKIVADSSWLALPALEHRENLCEKVLHLTRDPWDILRGWLFDFESVFSVWSTNKPMSATNLFLMKHCPVVGTTMNPVERAVRYYIDWNDRITMLSHKYRVCRIAVESDVSEIMHKVLDTEEGTWTDVSRTTNTRRKCVLTRNQVDALVCSSVSDNLYKCFLNLARKYGYARP